LQAEARLTPDQAQQYLKGQQPVVTANGKPKFVVNRSRRPKMTRKLAEARAVGSVGAAKFDGTAFLGSLKRC
jgi:hypothetical protein